MEKIPLNISRPDLCKEWDCEKNGEGPENYTSGSVHKAWWICEKNFYHKWQAVIQSRTRYINKISGCPYCSNHKVCNDNNLNVLFPEIAKEFHPTKNGNKKANDFVFGSHSKVWWQCSKNKKHEWKAAIVDRTGANKSCCPYCVNQKINDDNNLNVLFPKISKEWHPLRNNKLKPENFAPGSNKKIWWKCEENHEWISTIKYRTSSYKKNTKFNKGSCPYCSGQKLTEYNNLLFKFPEICKEWHLIKNDDKKPENFTWGSHYKAWWQCSKNKNHVWQASISGRTAEKGTNCPYCDGKKVDKNNNLLFKFPEIAKEFHPIKNGDKIPEDFVAGSNKKAWWQCKKNKKHEWFATIGDRTGSHNSGCPHCCSNISKSEIKWLNILNIPADCRNVYLKLPNGKTYKPDAYDPTTNTVYEFNGDYWHGNPNKFKSSDINARNKKTFGELYINTIKKEAELKSFGYNVISIWESEFNEIYRDNNDNL